MLFTAFLRFFANDCPPLGYLARNIVSSVAKEAAMVYTLEDKRYEEQYDRRPKYEESISHPMGDVFGVALWLRNEQR
jgi:hypothetical protein